MVTGANPLPPKIDGVVQNPIKDGAYVPEGILSHEYFPLETVQITQLNSDLSYMASYWEVDKIWRLYIQDVDTYDRLRAKLLQQRVVVVDYTDMNSLGIYLPKTTYVSGIEEMFKTVLDNLREMDRETLDRHLAEAKAGYRNIDGLLKDHYERI